jgi:sulfur carrier protein
MTVIVNGSPQELEDGCTVAALVAAATPPQLAAHTAVARNGEVVPRSAWDRTPLADGDRVELLTAAQGG